MRTLVVLSILALFSAPALAGKPSVKSMPPFETK